jgi:hypothetical protein
MDRLDTVVGPENWQDRYEVHGPRVIGYLSVRINDEWITKADGAGDTQVEAEKGGLSDALKRSAVKWGIGRYLYDLGNVWVECEQRGRSTIIKPGQEKKLIAALNALHSAQPAADRAKPDSVQDTGDAMRKATEAKWLAERKRSVPMADGDSERIKRTLQEGMDLAETLDDWNGFIADNQDNISFLIDSHYLEFKWTATNKRNALNNKARAHG